MLTLYSIVKGFEGHTDVIQHNALHSWLTVLPTAEVILFGDDEPGAKDVAASHRLPILPLPRNEHGAPLLPKVIQTAHWVGRYDTRLLVNADIILPPNIADAIRTVQARFDAFLLCARRMKVRVDYLIDFSDKDWFAWLKELDCRIGISSAIDVFCYRGEWLRDVPAFGVGRTSWDNWMLNKARTEGVPVIDGTPVFFAWHQEHAKHKPADQVAQNRALLGPGFVPAHGSLDAATWLLKPEGLVERTTR